MSQVKQSPTTRASKQPVDVIPDLFGYTVHLDGYKLHIPTERLSEVIAALAYWLKPGHDSKELIRHLATQHGILSEDLFPEPLAAHQGAVNG